MPTISFLHTAELHVEAFGALVADVAPRARDLHVVDPGLLTDARACGITGNVQERVSAHLVSLSREADVIVCTCSTLGDAAERLADRVDTPVIRIDRPMAEQAVRVGRCVGVVAAVESTLEPTRALLDQCSGGRGTEVVLEPCLEAWPLFEAADVDGYHALLAEHVRHLAPRVDVVVLAQASMAAVEALVADIATPVLSSPRLAVEATARIGLRESSAARPRWAPAP